MRLGNERESVNFEDHTAEAKNRMLRLLLQSQAVRDHYIEDNQAPGGYANWLTHVLNTITPDEREMMKKNGLSFNDIYIMRNLHNFPMDPSIAVYKRNVQLRRQQQDY